MALPHTTSGRCRLPLLLPSDTMADRRTRFQPGLTSIFSFVIVAFVLPGVYGAITGSAPPAPWQMGSWAIWIAFCVGVFLFGYAVTKVVLRLLERREHR